MKIYSDSPLSESARRLLQEGVAPHGVVFRQKPSASVLAQAGPDPAFDGVDVAFGQPDVSTVLQSKRLRWIHLTSAGYARYDTSAFREAAQERGLAVTNSSMVYSEPCAEHAFAFMLAQARGLPTGLKSRCKNGSTEWNQLRNASVPLKNQQVVIVGYGAIGARLVELLGPLEMQITAMRRKPTGKESVPTFSVDRLPAALAQADHVMNILPENEESVHFFAAERLACIKQGAVYYNIGRGRTVDQNALLEALNSGRLSAAWLDVTDPEPLPAGHPLLSAPNCYITPHTAGGHRNESESLVRHFLKNFGAFLSGAPLADRIM